MTLLAAGLASAAPASQPERPGVLRHRVEGELPTLWVSAQAATGPDRQVAWDVLGPGAYDGFLAVKNLPSPRALPFDPERPRYDEGTSGPRHDCLYWGPSFYSRAENPPKGSLADLTRHSRAIFKGRVTGTDEGFFEGEPHSLLTIKVQRVLKESASFRSSDTVYLLYPRARFTIGDTTFCKGDPRYPDRPDIGDRVVLFAYTEPRDAGGTVILADPESIFIQRNRGSLEKPTKLRDDPLLDDLETIDSLATWVDSRL